MPKRKQTTSKVNFKPNELYSTEIKVNGNEINISFPKEILSNLKQQDGKIFWTINGGSVEIHGKAPKLVLPAIKMDVDDFIPQPA